MGTVKPVYIIGAGGYDTNGTATFRDDSMGVYSASSDGSGGSKNPDFVAVKDNPTATFKTTKVEKTPTGYTVTGDLTLRGKTASISFPATVSAVFAGAARVIVSAGSICEYW